MKKTFKTLICLMLILIVFVSYNASGFAKTSASTSANEQKISELLSAEMQSKGTIKAFVWFSDKIEKADIQSQVFKKINLSKQKQNVILGKTSALELDLSPNTDDVDNYIAEKNKLYIAQYESQNRRYATEHLKDQKILFSSILSSVIVIETNAECIKKLATKDDVLYLDLYVENGKDELDVSIPVIESGIVNTNGYTGSGVRIGQVESGVPDSSTGGVAATKGSVTGHATNVARIINSVAPDAAIYSASTNESYTISNVCTNTTGIMAATEWLIATYNVNIINYSYTPNTNSTTYDSYCRWADHIAINHDVHVVKAAGNSGSTGVTTPGMAYNVVTVGNINDKTSTDLTEHIINSSSSYSSIANLAYKPDICAPGTNIAYNGVNMGSGTSYAAPHVVGTIALMCQQNTNLKVLQNTVKSILVATTNSKSPYYYVPKGWNSSLSSNYSHYGAGLLNSKNAYTSVRYGRFYNSSFTPAQVSAGTMQTYTFNVTSGMTHIRVAMTYLHTVSNSTHSFSIGNSYSIPNLNIKVYYGSTLVGTSTCSYSNVEIIDFDPKEYGTGTYTVQIIPVSDSATTTNTYYAVAWW